MNNDESTKIARKMKDVIDSNGFGFQHAVGKRIADVRNRGWGWWEQVASEFPVTLNGVETHIDLVLADLNGRYFAVVECKRANPAFNAWGFARTVPRLGPVICDQLILNSENKGMRQTARMNPAARHSDLGFRLKTGENRGDASGGNPAKEMQEPINQVLRGAAGFLDHLAESIRDEPPNSMRLPKTVLPIIVTTASLWWSPTDVSAAELETGEIDLSRLQPEKVPFLWYSFNRSRSFMSDIPSLLKAQRLVEWVENESTRTIAIVNASGLDDFLQDDSYSDLLSR